MDQALQGLLAVRDADERDLLDAAEALLEVADAMKWDDENWTRLRRARTTVARVKARRASEAGL
jgi:hypothetical protein